MVLFSDSPFLKVFPCLIPGIFSVFFMFLIHLFPDLIPQQSFCYTQSKANIWVDPCLAHSSMQFPVVPECPSTQYGVNLFLSTTTLNFSPHFSISIDVIFGFVSALCAAWHSCFCKHTGGLFQEVL